MSPRLIVLPWLLTLATSGLVVPQAQIAQKGTLTPLLYTSAAQYEPLAWLAGGERFPQGATVFVRTNGRAKPLLQDFFATADANVSFDAQTVLLSGKRRPTDHWQIWEISISAGTPRQVTRCDNDCIKPIYVPGERFVYAHKLTGHFVLEIAPLDGEEPALQLTHIPGSSLPNDLLHDGRILFSSGFPFDNSKRAELYTAYTDGSGAEAYRCDHGHSRHAGKQLASGDVIFARDGKLYRFTSALAHETSIPAPERIYAGDIAESINGSWIVSARTLVGKFFELRMWKPNVGHLAPLASDAKANLVGPALLIARPVPNRHPSALHEWSYANVLCLNAYVSRDPIPEGSIVSVRLYSRDELGATQVQGTAQVEKDGSFYLRVPGDRPVRIELLDASGKTIKSEAGWFWLRRGEQRICVGCHAGPERAPENAVPLILQRSTVAADLSAKPNSQAPAAGGH